MTTGVTDISRAKPPEMINEARTPLKLAQKVLRWLSIALVVGWVVFARLSETFGAVFNFIFGG